MFKDIVLDILIIIGSIISIAFGITITNNSTLLIIALESLICIVSIINIKLTIKNNNKIKNKGNNENDSSN